MMPINPKTEAAIDFARLLRAGAILLDVRTEEEFVGFHLEGAVNIPYEELERNVDAIRRWKRPVIVYSADDQRSRRAMIRLRNHGVVVYDGGSRDCLWQALEDEM